MAVQKSEFFEIENKKVMAIHKQYSAMDEKGKNHCSECPYSLNMGYHHDCLFERQINQWEKEWGK